MIASQNLRFSYSPSKSFSFPDIHCNDRETLLILGQSGKGKTTLLHLLALLLKPDSGEIAVNGSSVVGLAASQLTDIRAKKIGIIYQRAHFVSALSVLDNILMPNYWSGKKQDRRKPAICQNNLALQIIYQKKPIN